MKKQCLVIVTALSLVVQGCANMSETQKGTATGAGIGAVTGAVIGRATSGSHTGRDTSRGAAIGAAAGAGIGYLWSKKMEEQKRQMEQATQGTGVKVSQTDDNRLKLDIPSDISFDSGKANIKSNFRPILDKFASSLQNHQTTTVTIIGHTDSTGGDKINNPLSVNRASNARDYLVSKGISSSRFNIEGRGSREPIADNGTPAGRAKNRRVEIYVAEVQQ